MRKITTLLAVAATLGLVAGCGGGKKVTRVETDTTIDLSGNWNDTDSRLTAEALIQQATGAAWVVDHLQSHGGKKPAVIVGTIRNLSHEHITVKTFVADLERAFINSGRVTVVASRDERGELRDEREDQQQYASPESIKQWGRELGADYMLLGEINTITDRDDGDEVKYYQVDVYLVDLETNVKVWAGQKKIKKYVSRSGYRP